MSLSYAQAYREKDTPPTSPTVSKSTNDDMMFLLLYSLVYSPEPEAHATVTDMYT